MTKLLSLLNSTVADLIMKTQPVFEEWRDNNSLQFKSSCIDDLTRCYKQYINEMHVRSKIFLQSEKKATDALMQLIELR